MNNTVDRQEFKKVWDKHGHIKDVAKELGITYGTARTLAWKYRKEGLKLEKKSAGRK